MNHIAISNTNLNEDEQAEMGIGMMIIFIAMVLVAAVAAAVIITTANEVREQAQRTGDQAIADVSTGLVTQQVVGDRSDDTGTETATVQYLELKLKLHSGSPDIDMSDILIIINDGATETTMTFNPNVDASSVDNAKRLSTDQSTFSAIARIDNDGSFNHSVSDTDFVVNKGDMISIFVNCTGLNLDENTNVDLRIVPMNGAQTLEKFTTPDVYSDRFIKLLG
jgi:archaeal flagellin FlaB